LPIHVVLEGIDVADPLFACQVNVDRQMEFSLRVKLDRLIAGMNAFAEFLRHLVMPDCSRRGRKWRLGARKTESASKTKDESEMFHRASVSKRFLSVNSQKLSMPVAPITSCTT
jgi:hypothetical protein